MYKSQILEALPNMHSYELAEIIKKAQGIRRESKFKKDMILRGERDRFWEEIRKNIGIRYANPSTSHNRWSFDFASERFCITLGTESFNVTLYGTPIAKKRIQRSKLGSVDMISVLTIMIKLRTTKQVLDE